MENKILLITRFLKGDIKPNELQELTNWLKENEENKAYFEKLKSIWAESGQLGELIQPDTKLALKKVHHAIRQKPIKVMPYISATYLRAVAAVFIIGLISFVTWQLVNKTAKPAELQVVESVNLKKEIHLSDGTIVWLNKTSKLTFPQQFNDSIRKVELEGEAFFEVAKNPAQPFIVSAGNSETRVLGTKFNVRAIADERKISVTLLEGKILLSKNAENKRQSVVLEKGEQGLIDNLSEELSKNENPDINYLSWKTGIFQFDNQNLENIIKRISEYYNVSYRFENEKLKNCKLTVVFRNQQLKDVLKTISLTLDIEIKLTDNQIVINGKPCK